MDHYSNEPTDTASSGTSSELKEALCKSAGEKLDREVSLTSRIRESRFFRGCLTEGGNSILGGFYLRAFFC